MDQAIFPFDRGIAKATYQVHLETAVSLDGPNHGTQSVQMGRHHAMLVLVGPWNSHQDAAFRGFAGLVAKGFHLGLDIVHNLSGVACWRGGSS